MSDSVPPSNVASAEPVSCVRVVPEQFKIEVKTTARDRYLLRPTQDYIPAGGSKVCKIVMSALRAYPDLSNPKNLKDKFLVQATNIAGEVPDLTKFWKDLETQHNPKAGVFKYAETKIKCKLSVPAKYRAADATKRGLEEEAAAAAAMASAGGDKSGEQQMAAQQPLQSQPMQSQQPPQPRSTAAASDDLHARRKLSDDDMSSSSFAALALEDPVASHSVPATAASAAAPSSSAAASAPSSASSLLASSAASSISSAVPAVPGSSSGAASSSSSLDPTTLARQLKASESKYAELMSFVVTTTQQLETERQEKESWESRAQTSAQSLAQALAKLDALEAKLREAREETKRALQSGSDSKLDSESEGARRRKLDGNSSSGNSSSKAVDDAASKSSVSSSSSSLQSSSSSLSSTKKPQPGLALAFWQIALMALVCFVLGRIFA